MADWHKASIGAEAGKQARQQLAGAEGGDPLPFVSRRSPVLCRNGCVASSQPLASSVGLDALRRGANAAEAGIAVAAVLAVVEPCSTGLGGDMFCLYYDAAKKTVSAISGCGKSPSDLTLELLQDRYPDGKGGTSLDEFRFSPHSVTVPGAARGWEDLYLKHGNGDKSTFTFAELLEPAAQLATDGFPVGPVTSYLWKTGLSQITKWLGDDEYVPQTLRESKSGRHRGPEPGEIVTNPDLARVLRELGSNGATKGFYENPTIGQEIVNVVRKHGGCLSMKDLRGHTTSDFPNAIRTDYRGLKLWQCPPNGQGIAGLVALSGLASLEETGVIQPPLTKEDVGTDRWYHSMIEMMRLGFADARAYVSDPDHMTVTTDWLLDKKRIGDRAAKLFDARRAGIEGMPDASNCTVSFQVVDKHGNALSFVNSNYMGFGAGMVPKNCGFTLQNRGAGFTLDKPDHPNCVGPSKRPCHTIIPAMLTHSDTNDLYATLSNMGGNMQPQGHLQLTVDMLAGGLNPQEAIDAPRFCIVNGTQSGPVFLEQGVAAATVKRLQNLGHSLTPNVTGFGRAIFGRAQIIKRDRATGVLWAGSDGRCDGCAIGY